MNITALWEVLHRHTCLAGRAKAHRAWFCAESWGIFAGKLNCWSSSFLCEQFRLISGEEVFASFVFPLRLALCVDCLFPGQDGNAGWLILQVCVLSNSQPFCGYYYCHRQKDDPTANLRTQQPRVPPNVGSVLVEYSWNCVELRL